MAVRLARSPEERAQQEAAAVLAQVPEEHRPGPEQDEATRWMADPSRLLRVCDAAVPRLVALPAPTPSLRLLADQTAELLRGISPALNGLALLVADPARPVARSRGVRRLRIPDWLPPFVDAGRTFVAMGAAELFWIVTASMAERRRSHHLCHDRCHPVRAARRPSLHHRDQLLDRQHLDRGYCRNN